MSAEESLANLTNELALSMGNISYLSQGQNSSANSEAKIDELLSRLNSLASGSAGTPEHCREITSTPLSATPAPKQKAHEKNRDIFGEFFPDEPETLAAAKVSESIVEELILKYLLSKGEASIRQIAGQIGMTFNIVDAAIGRMKNEQLLGYANQAAMNDYICKLTEMGRARARQFNDYCTYFGSVPVCFEDYVEAVNAQTITKQQPAEADLKRAFADLLIDPVMMKKLGPAVNSGRGLFLFGYPGNGKTSIAERITLAFGPYIWVPRAITMDRDIVRIFDPMQHEEAPPETGNGFLSDAKYDQRWVRIKRPTIVVGGELTMEQLEIQYNSQTGISEAPVQMKSNCGLLLIDDFGRQRMSVDELLNRWIVPLEKRYDYLSTSNGKKVRVPFDQLVVFSTNLEPKDLVDDAFLRRIPYKIEVENPTTENFIKLFQIMCKIHGFEWRPELIQYLLQTHYMPKNRPLRNCHPRDLLLQVKNFCRYNRQPMELSRETLDFACENYFSIM